MKIKGPILVVNRTHYACGNRKIFVSRVTEKVIVVVCNDMCETYYRRDDGYPKHRQRSGLGSIGIPRINSISNLEAWLKDNGTYKNGVYVYDSGFRTAYDSKDRLVRPLVKEAWKRACDQNRGQDKSLTALMLKELGYKFIDLR